MHDLTEILLDIDNALRLLKHAADGLTPEDPLAAIRSLGELADELEQIGDIAAEPSETPTR